MRGKKIGIIIIIIFLIVAIVAGVFAYLFLKEIKNYSLITYQKL